MPRSKTLTKQTAERLRALYQHRDAAVAAWEAAKRSDDRGAAAQPYAALCEVERAIDALCGGEEERRQ